MSQWEFNKKVFCFCIWNIWQDDSQNKVIAPIFRTLYINNSNILDDPICRMFMKLKKFSKSCLQLHSKKKIIFERDQTIWNCLLLPGIKWFHLSMDQGNIFFYFYWSFSFSFSLFWFLSASSSINLSLFTFSFSLYVQAIYWYLSSYLSICALLLFFFLLNGHPIQNPRST